MGQIERAGSPRAVGTKNDEIIVAVPLNASPSPEWVHFFREMPSEYTSMAHPKLVDVEGTDLVFSSEERLFADWIRLIDRWIGDANRHYEEHLDRLRRKQAQQEDQNREQQRRVQEATEKLKGL